MTRRHRLTCKAPWVELRTSERDWLRAGPRLLTDIYAQLVLIRVFAEYVLDLAGKGLIHSLGHSSIDQEGGAVGAALALGTNDTVNGSHRGHHHFLAEALRYLRPDGLGATAASRTRFALSYCGPSVRSAASTEAGSMRRGTHDAFRPVRGPSARRRCGHGSVHAGVHQPPREPAADVPWHPVR